LHALRLDAMMLGMVTLVLGYINRMFGDIALIIICL